MASRHQLERLKIARFEERFDSFFSKIQGTGYPPDEFDSLADAAYSTFARTGDIEAAVREVIRRLRTEWELELSPETLRTLREFLNHELPSS